MREPCRELFIYSDADFFIRVESGESAEFRVQSTDKIVMTKGIPRLIKYIYLNSEL